MSSHSDLDAGARVPPTAHLKYKRALCDLCTFWNLAQIREIEQNYLYLGIIAVFEDNKLLFVHGFVVDNVSNSIN